MTNTIPWEILSHFELNEDVTALASRKFIKILLQSLSDYMGLAELIVKLKKEELQKPLSGLFPKDDPRKTDFAINFYFTIGLEYLTDDLQKYLKSRPKATVDSMMVDKKKSDSSPSSSASSESSRDKKKKRKIITHRIKKTSHFKRTKYPKKSNNQKKRNN